MTESEAAPVLVLKSQTVAVSVPRSPHEFVCLVCSLHLPRWIRAHLFSPHKWNVAEEQPSAETRPGLWRSGWRRQGLHCVFTASSLRSLSVLLVRCHVSYWALGYLHHWVSVREKYGQQMLRRNPSVSNSDFWRGLPVISKDSMRLQKWQSINKEKKHESLQ